MAIEVVSIEVVEPKVQAESAGEKNKGGRPKGRDYINGKYHGITMRVDLRTYNRIEKMAKKSKVSMGKYCAQRMVEAPEILPIEKMETLNNDIKDLQRIMKEIQSHVAHLGGNINQAQKRFNEIMVAGRESKRFDVAQGKYQGYDVIAFKVWNKQYKRYEEWADVEYCKLKIELEQIKQEIESKILMFGKVIEEVKNDNQVHQNEKG